jgi:hypothetical protein
MNKNSIVNIVIILALITQVTHAAWVFGEISQSKTEWYDTILSYVFAISLELSIYIFTIFSKKKVATFFAVISTMLNLLYYWFEVAFSFQFVAMLVISPIIPVTIWYYSELLDEINKPKLGRPKLK